MEKEKVSMLSQPPREEAQDVSPAVQPNAAAMTPPTTASAVAVPQTTPIEELKATANHAFSNPFAAVDHTQPPTIEVNLPSNIATQHPPNRSTAVDIAERIHQAQLSMASKRRKEIIEDSLSKLPQPRENIQWQFTRFDADPMEVAAALGRRGIESFSQRVEEEGLFKGTYKLYIKV